VPGFDITDDMGRTVKGVGRDHVQAALTLSYAISPRNSGKEGRE
jgi:hypothetical protein